MEWKEIQEKGLRLQAEGKTVDEAAGMLKDEIGVFAKECIEHPEKVTDVTPELGKIVQDNPIFSVLLSILFFRNRDGWG